MNEQHFSIAKFQSQWDSLSPEQRSLDGREIVLTFSEAEIHMEITDENGTAVALPWHYETDEPGMNLLLQVLQHMGIPVGCLDDYMTDEIVEEAATETHTEADQEPQPERDPNWINYEPEDSTAKKIGMAAIKALTVAGTVYMAYRIARKAPDIGTMRFS
jgi:hypothetical protein